VPGVGNSCSSVVVDVEVWFEGTISEKDLCAECDLQLTELTSPPDSRAARILSGSLAYFEGQFKESALLYSCALRASFRRDAGLQLGLALAAEGCGCDPLVDPEYECLPCTAICSPLQLRRNTESMSTCGGDHQWECCRPEPRRRMR